MSKYKTHMVFYSDNEGSFRTGCKIDDHCSEDFYDNAKLVAFGNDSETTCKKCLEAYQKALKAEQAEEQRMREFNAKIDAIAVNTQIFDQPHQMYAEGMNETEPKERDVEYLLIAKGYRCNAFESFYDDLQKCWRWTAEIKLLDSALEQLKTG